MNKNYIPTILLFTSIVLFISCGGDSEQNDENVPPPKSMLSAEPKTLEEAEQGWKTNYGIGPISNFKLPAEIDQTLAETGKVVYNAKCTACHKPTEVFIGPPPKGILERRTPAWIMNMILDPETMVLKDPIAKQLLIKFNMSPMANQSLTQDEARAVLEYFRTL